MFHLISGSVFTVKLEFILTQTCALRKLRVLSTSARPVFTALKRVLTYCEFIAFSEYIFERDYGCAFLP